MESDGNMRRVVRPNADNVSDIEASRTSFQSSSVLVTQC